MARSPKKQYPLPPLRTLSGCFLNLEAFVIDTLRAFKYLDIFSELRETSLLGLTSTTRQRMHEARNLLAEIASGTSRLSAALGAVFPAGHRQRCRAAAGPVVLNTSST